MFNDDTTEEVVVGEDVATETVVVEGDTEAVDVESTEAVEVTAE